MSNIMIFVCYDCDESWQSDGGEDVRCPYCGSEDIEQDEHYEGIPDDVVLQLLEQGVRV